MPTLKARIGGAWVDVGGSGGASEVEIGPNDPIGTNASAELWYDTDAVAPLNNDMRWYTAWGAVGVANTATTQSVGTSFTTLNNVAVTFTAVPGRRYAITATFSYRQRTTAGAVYLRILEAGLGTLVDELQSVAAADQYATTTIAMSSWTPPGTGPYTIRLAGQTTSSTVEFQAYGMTTLIVEDIGPTSGTNVAPAEADLRWFSAWGVVATFVNATDVPGIGAAETTVNSGTFSGFVAGRKYSLMVRQQFAASSAADTYYLRANIDGSNVLFYVPAATTVSQVFSLPTFSYSASTSGSKVVNVTVVRAFGTGTGACSNLSYINAIIDVIDEGPVTGAAIIPQVAVTAWTALPFATGWRDFGGGYQPCQYRKYGDKVELRGLAQATTGFTAVVGTLPVGFRPPANLIVGTISGPADTFGRVDITAAGSVNYQAGAALVANSTYISLTVPPFSVST